MFAFTLFTLLGLYLPLPRSHRGIRAASGLPSALTCGQVRWRCYTRKNAALRRHFYAVCAVLAT